jgi:hypothetical protein
MYDGAALSIFLDGALESRVEWSGLLLTTSIDLTIGQMLPHDAGYNFNGVLDDIRIYSYALSPEEIANIFSEGSAIHTPSAALVPEQFVLRPNYPNPFRGATVIEYTVPRSCKDLRLQIVDALGREVLRLEEPTTEPGYRRVSWDGTDAQSRPVPSGIYFAVLSSEERRLSCKLLLVR